MLLALKAQRFSNTRRATTYLNFCLRRARGPQPANWKQLCTLVLYHVASWTAGRVIILHLPLLKILGRVGRIQKAEGARTFPLIYQVLMRLSDQEGGSFVLDFLEAICQIAML
jgi:hypothetical protein